MSVTRYGGGHSAASGAPISSLVAPVKAKGYGVHLDGARLANAWAAGFDVAAVGKLGVDLLVVGGTKAPSTRVTITNTGNQVAKGTIAINIYASSDGSLSNDDVLCCQYLIHIPTDPTYPALNLAQAVAICLYELRRAALADNQATPTDRPAPFADQERMFARLRQALQQVGFLHGERADALWHAVRHLIGRAGPTPMEVKLLLGLARQLAWFARRGGKSPGG